MELEKEKVGFSPLVHFVIGATVILTVAIMIIVSCGKPAPPDPSSSDFSLKSTGVLIEGKLKAGSSVTVAEALRTLQVAADMIGAKNK